MHERILMMHVEVSTAPTPSVVPRQFDVSSYPPRRVFKLFSCTANRELAQEVAACLGVELGRITIRPFANGETYVKINESVRDADVFVLQSLCPNVDNNLMQHLNVIDAMKRSSARSVTAVITHYGYGRSDRKSQGRESIMAKLVADLYVTAGVDSVVILELHATQGQAFFDIKTVDHIWALPVLLPWMSSIQQSLPEEDQLEKFRVVSPDYGGVSRARAYAKELGNVPIIFGDKRRPKAGQAEILNVVGDPEDKVCVLVDDIIDTAGTIVEMKKELIKRGARKVYAAGAHAVLSDPANERLSIDPFDGVAVTNSIPVSKLFRSLVPNLSVLSCAAWIAENVSIIFRGGSISHGLGYIDD